MINLKILYKNVFHQLVQILLIIGADFRTPNSRYITDVIVNLPDSLESVINNNSKGFTECTAVNNCEGCIVLCNAFISVTKENQISIMISKSFNAHNR